MLQSKLKINRTTWGLSVPYRRPSHQPPHFLPSVSLHYYCKSFIYLLCSHTCKGTAVEVKWTCLLKTGTSIFCRFSGGGYTSGRLQGHDSLQVDSLVSAPYSWPNWDEGIVGRWGGKEAEGQHGWQTMEDRNLDQASGRTELQSYRVLVYSPDCKHGLQAILITFINSQQRWRSM